MATGRPIGDTTFGVALESTGPDLLDIDVFYTFVILVMTYVEHYSYGADELSLDPTNALQTENLVAVIAERLVL